jgi:hypothetical protein
MREGRSTSRLSCCCRRCPVAVKDMALGYAPSRRDVQWGDDRRDRSSQLCHTARRWRRRRARRPPPMRRCRPACGCS